MPSERELMALVLPELLLEIGLIPGSPQISQDRRYRYVTFTHNKGVAGEIIVYADDYFAVSDCYSETWEVFDNLEMLQLYLTYKYVNVCPEKANGVPRRAKRLPSGQALSQCGPRRLLEVTHDFFGHGSEDCY